MRRNLRFLRRLPTPGDVQTVASATEQTGLIPALPQSETQEESYETIYPVHRQKD